MSGTSDPHVVIVAGEASADQHGARLIAQLKQMVPDLKVSGIGGPALQSQGAVLLYPSSDLAIMGVSEAIIKLGKVLKILRGMKRHLARTKPVLLILIDLPDFNFRLGKTAKKMGIKVLYYICPQVWAWRQGRARTMASFVDHLAVVFPFEKEFMARLAPDLPVSFVGYPMFDQPPEQPREDIRLEVPEGKTLVGIVPGSRHSEIRRLLPLHFETARLMQKERDDLCFALPLAPGLSTDDLRPYMDRAPSPLQVLPGGAKEIMGKSRFCLVTSGTASLETALAGCPMVVVYKVSLLNCFLARALLKVDCVAMPNLIAGRIFIPEFLQNDAKPEIIAQTALELMQDGPARKDMIQTLGEIKQSMGGPGASLKTARLACHMMGETQVEIQPEQI